MKKSLLTLALMVLAVPAFACDEACMRERAATTHNVEFPGYLNWGFCADTKAAFMDHDVSSLKSYRSKRLNIEHRNRMTRIKEFVEQRKEWLRECDDYYEKTDHGRIFKDEQTTKKIFNAMDSVSKELGSALAGATYVNEEGQEDVSIIGTKFDQFFDLVETHRTVMALQDQFVTN